MDVDGNHKTKISAEGFLETDKFFGSTVYLTAWSDDEKFLVYYASPDEQGMRTESKLILPLMEGFYTADLKSGMVYFIPRIKDVIGFIPATDKLVFFDERVQDATLFTWDLKTDEIDILSKKTIDGNLTGQYYFSKDGHMVYGYGEANSANPSRSAIIYANLDNTNQKEIASGGFADIQWPNISSDGKFIAYITYKDVLCSDGNSGCNDGTIVLYNILTGQKENLVEKVKAIRYWWDDENILFLQGEYEGPWLLQLFNLSNRTAMTISTNEVL